MHRELWRRIAFTLAALFVVRLGVAIPLPGINAEVWMNIFRQHEAGPLGVASLFSGGGLRSLSILALSVTPYVSAAVLVQMFTMVSRRLRRHVDAVNRAAAPSRSMSAAAPCCSRHCRPTGSRAGSAQSTAW